MENKLSIMKENNKVLENQKLVTFIVKKGLGTRVVSAAKRAGAEGGTIAFGRGTAGRHIYESILGIDFEPEKEVIIIVVGDEDQQKVVNEVNEEVGLNKPGRGIGFVLDLKKCLGVAHLHQL